LPIYSLDVELVETAEKTVLQRFAGKSFVKPSPDTRYQWLAEKQEILPQANQQRPVIVGFGACGIIAALLLA
jgi:uncharacterized FAD-dependent dehydrogenase